MGNIKSFGKEKNSELINFVNCSRHQKISIVCFYHEIPFNSSICTFERYFFNQSSHFVVFDFKINLFQVRMFASRILGKNLVPMFFSAFDISKQLCKIDNKLNNSHKRPYLILNADHRCDFNDTLMKVQADIFKRKLTFSSGHF